jgi:iron complex outermembrane receptor protein
VPGVINARARSYVNHDERRWGLEGSARWTAGERLLLTLSGAYVRGDRDLAPELGVGDRDLPEMPPLNTRLALRYDPGRWFVEGETVAAARQSRVDSGLSETPTPGVVVGNLRGGFEQGPVSLYVGVDNLFDRAYRSHLSYQRDPFRSGTAVPEPGRTFTASLRFRR